MATSLLVGSQLVARIDGLLGEPPKQFSGRSLSVQALSCSIHCATGRPENNIKTQFSLGENWNVTVLHDGPRT